MSLNLYNETCFKIGDLITKNYSTSFSIAINLFDSEIRNSITSIYAFVRLADEIVDSFHGFDKNDLLEKLRDETFLAINNGISTNPVINCFQITVNKYKIPDVYINDFLNSMEMDISNNFYKRNEYDKYVYGSAEVVGLMCLKVFCSCDEKLFSELISPARALGSAFQKVNFLRDIKSDISERGRIYFPDTDDLSEINHSNKSRLENEIESEFEEALRGIKKLPKSCKLAVYSAYIYYYMLFKKIRKTGIKILLSERVRLSNFTKLILLIKSAFEVKLTNAIE